MSNLEEQINDMLASIRKQLKESTSTEEIFYLSSEIEYYRKILKELSEEL